MSNQTSTLESLVKVTPLFGGRGDLNAIAVVLQLGEVKIMFDCGLPINKDILTNKFLSTIQTIDLIVLSHADHQHLGALPLIQGKLGHLAKPIPILCTLPVHKFGLMVLYDMFLNQAMEGIGEASTTASSQQRFDLDDVDRAFEATYTVKYCQQVSLSQILSRLNLSISSSKYVDINKIFFCAYASGSTIGGAMWRIRYGHAEIQYAMDIYLKKELVLNGAALDMLPSTPPSLLIVDAGDLYKQHYPNHHNQHNTGNSNIPSKRDRDDYHHILASVMITLRDGGNVIIPCDTAGRSLEYLQHFAKYWYDNKLGLYHLVFLSHMATNTFEYAISQLEWMNDSLSKAFYNGKPNPFDIKQVKRFTAIRDMERSCHGPKVIFATDASLSYGLSKECLLRYGGDPKNKVIFLDYAYEGSIAYDIRCQLASPPIVISITQPKRVELMGDELLSYKREKERIKRAADAAIQRQLLLKELNLFDITDQEPVDDHDDKDEEKKDKDIMTSADQPVSKRQKLQSSNIHRFTEPLYPMFQTQAQQSSINEYGLSNADLQFKDIAPVIIIDHKQHHQKDNTSSNAARNPPPIPSLSSTAAMTDNDQDEINSIPHKLIAIKSKLQLTCQFYESSVITGKADHRAIRSLIAKVNPSSVLILRGRDHDCDQIISHTLSQNIKSHALANHTSISYSFQADRLRMHIIQSLLTSSMKTITSSSDQQQHGETRICSVSGMVGENPYESGRDGIRMVRLLDSSQQDVAGIEDVTDTVGNDDMTDNQPTADDSNTITNSTSSSSEIINYMDTDSNMMPALTISHGKAVSVGEIMLDKLKMLLESKHHIAVEFRLGSAGAMLICGGSTIVRKENDNDFVVEGAPGPTYYAVRRALYQQIAFL